MTKRINFTHKGSVYNMSVDLLDDLLTTAGHTLHSAVPLQIIDNVGFLKTGDDAKQIVADLLAKSLPDGDTEITTADWPFPTSGTDSQMVLDLDDDEVNQILNGGIDIDMGSVYWAPPAGLNRGKIKTVVDMSHVGDAILLKARKPAPADVGFFYCPYIPLALADEAHSYYSACMNRDRE
jgi:hypothetical protein